jgi:hypothetical protein
MALPSSGQISLGQVRTELGQSHTSFGMQGGAALDFVNKNASAEIKLSEFRGKFSHSVQRYTRATSTSPSTSFSTSSYSAALSSAQNMNTTVKGYSVTTFYNHPGGSTSRPGAGILFRLYRASSTLLRLQIRSMFMQGSPYNNEAAATYKNSSGGTTSMPAQYYQNGNTWYTVANITIPSNGFYSQFDIHKKYTHTHTGTSSHGIATFAGVASYYATYGNSYDLYRTLNVGQSYGKNAYTDVLAAYGGSRSEQAIFTLEVKGKTDSGHTRTLHELDCSLFAYINVTRVYSGGSSGGGSSGGGSSGGCFIAGSLVTMADGTTKPIEEIVVGDVVRGNVEDNEVIELRHQESVMRSVVRINDGLLEFTPGHPILTTEGWKAVDRHLAMELHPEMGNIPGLICGDTIVMFNSDGERVYQSVDSMGGYDEDIPVYNINVTGDDTYTVNNVIVHNK